MMADTMGLCGVAGPEEDKWDFMKTLRQAVSMLP